VYCSHTYKSKQSIALESDADEKKVAIESQRSKIPRRLIVDSSESDEDDDIDASHCDTDVAEDAAKDVHEENDLDEEKTCDSIELHEVSGQYFIPQMCEANSIEKKLSLSLSLSLSPSLSRNNVQYTDKNINLRSFLT